MTTTPPARTVPLLYGLFLLSGAAGLCYESVWSRYLGLFVGHAAYAQVLTELDDETVMRTEAERRMLADPEYVAFGERKLAANTRCNGPGWNTMCRNAATARPGRS